MATDSSAHDLDSSSTSSSLVGLSAAVHINQHLLRGVSKNEYDLALRTLTHGADPNFANDTHSSFMIPLIVAIRNNNFQMVKLLVEHGADVNCYTRTSGGGARFALRYAMSCYRKHFSDYTIAKYLLENVSNVPFGKNFELHTFLFSTAVGSKVDGLELIKLLHPHRATTELPSYRLVYGGLFAKSATIEIAEFLIDNDYPIEWNTLCKLCKKPHRAALNLEIMKLLCKKRIDIIHNIEAGATSRSLLSYAVSLEAYDIAKLLLEYGFDPNGVYNDQAVHPLFHLVWNASEEMDIENLEPVVDMIKTLARYGADFLATRRLYNNTSLYNGVCYMDVYNVLLENGAVLGRDDKLYIEPFFLLDASNLATPALRVRHWIQTGNILHLLRYLQHKNPQYISRIGEVRRGESMRYTIDGDHTVDATYAMLLDDRSYDPWYYIDDAQAMALSRHDNSITVPSTILHQEYPAQPLAAWLYCSHPHIWRHIRDKDYGNSADFRRASWLVALVYTVSKNTEEGIYTDATVFTLIPVELLGEIFQSLAVEYLMAPGDAEVPN